MKKIVSVLVATTALTTAMGLSAWSAMRIPAVAGVHSFASTQDDGRTALPFIFASDDDDDDEQIRHDSKGHDEDEGEDDDDNDDDDEDGEGKVRGPAPATATTPPQNGLFGNGALPKVQVK